MLTVDHGSLGMGAVTHSTIASKLGDLTVVAREGSCGRPVLSRATGIGLTRPASGHTAMPASTPCATRSASTSPASGRSSRCRRPRAATSTRSASGRWSARSRTARPRPTVTWPASWKTARPLRRSAPPSAGTLCASSSRAIVSSVPAGS